MKEVPGSYESFKQVARMITKAKYCREVKTEKYWICKLRAHYVKVL